MGFVLAQSEALSRGGACSNILARRVQKRHTFDAGTVNVLRMRDERELHVSFSKLIITNKATSQLHFAELVIPKSGHRVAVQGSICPRYRNTGMIGGHYVQFHSGGSTFWGVVSPGVLFALH